MSPGQERLRKNKRKGQRRNSSGVFPERTCRRYIGLLDYSQIASAVELDFISFKNIFIYGKSVNICESANFHCWSAIVAYFKFSLRMFRTSVCELQSGQLQWITRVQNSGESALGRGEGRVSCLGVA